MVQIQELKTLSDKHYKLENEIRTKAIEYILQELGDNGNAVFDRSNNEFLIDYDMGNCSCVAEGVYTRNGKVYIVIEECEDYDEFRACAIDVLQCAYALSNSFRVGDKVKWHDPALHNYPENERESADNRIFEITSIDYIGITISDGYTEAKVIWCELEKIKPATWDDVRNAMLKSKRLKKAYNRKETDMTFEYVVNEIVCLFEGMYHTMPEDYIDNENLWVSELHDLL